VGASDAPTSFKQTIGTTRRWRNYFVNVVSFAEDTAKKTKIAKYPQTKAATGANKRWNKSDVGETISLTSFVEDTAKKMNV